MDKFILPRPTNEEVEEVLLNIKGETIVDNKQLITIIAIKRNMLSYLKPLWFVVNEICDCLIINKQCAAMTLTNHLLESSLKLSLILWKAYGKPFDCTKDFETMYKDEVKTYIGKKMGENLKFAIEENMINNDEFKDLSDLMLEYRDHIDHDSNNKYIRESRTIIATYDFSTKETTENLNATVIGNPSLYLNTQESFMRKAAYGYFTHVYSYVMKWDKMLDERYIRNNSNK